MHKAKAGLGESWPREWNSTFSQRSSHRSSLSRGSMQLSSYGTFWSFGQRSHPVARQCLTHKEKCESFSLPLYRRSFFSGKDPFLDLTYGQFLTMLVHSQQFFFKKDRVHSKPLWVQFPSGQSKTQNKVELRRKTKGSHNGNRSHITKHHKAKRQKDLTIWMIFS
jgi:hypothetical protein